MSVVIARNPNDAGWVSFERRADRSEPYGLTVGKDLRTIVGTALQGLTGVPRSQQSI